MALSSKPELRCWSVRLAKKKNKKATKTNYSIAYNKFILHKFHKKHKTGSNTKIPPKIQKKLIVFVYQLLPRAKAVTVFISHKNVLHSFVTKNVSFVNTSSKREQG